MRRARQDVSACRTTRWRSANKPKRLLLVDDHNLFRQILAVVLEHHTNFDRSTHARSYAEARRALKRSESPVDLALVDVDMPDAAALVGELRAAGVPVLAVTASHASEQRAWAFEAGAREVLTTAAPVQEIIEAVRRLGGG